MHDPSEPCRSSSTTTTIRARRPKDIQANLDEMMDGMDRNELADPGRMTSCDFEDMSRMGKPQVLRRVFRQFSILSFTCIIMATWEYLLTANTQGLVCGGRAGVFWSYLWTLCGFGMVIASMAEMASMAPTSGGQYHWVSEFAPDRCQKFLSYTTGWLSVMSYQAGNASGFFLAGTIIQSLAQVNYPSTYSAPNWQSTICVLAVVVVSGVFNIWFSKFFPVLNNISMVVHLAGFVAIVVVLWVLAPHPPAAEVFLDFSNLGGWQTTGLSLMVGQISAIAALGCSDAAAHMSEEVSDAGLSVPRSMMWTFYINGSTGLVVLVAIIFAMPSVEDALNHPTGYPFLYIFQLAMPDNVGTNILTVVTVWGLLVGNVSFTASCARQVWSLARDRGLPFSAWISRMDTRVHIPVNATVLTLVCTVLLSLINLGSNAAFNAILSLQLSALMASYVIAITCIVLKRLRDPGSLPKARWSLGKFGLPINIVAMCYSMFACFWTFWPNSTPVDAESFNWAPAIFSVVMVCAMITYMVHGRYQFDGPVSLVKRM